MFYPPDSLASSQPLREPLLRVIATHSNGPSPANSPRVPDTPRWRRASRKSLSILLVVIPILVFGGLIFRTCQFLTSHDTVPYLPPSPVASRSTPAPVSSRKDAAIFKRCQKDDGARLPELKKVYSWRAQGQRAADDIAVLTQLSVERLSMLRLQCRVWTKEINAVVYVPHMKDFGVISDDVPPLNGTSLSSVAHLVDNFYRELESDKTSQCRLNMELVVEDFETWDDPAWSLYPTNSLRNRALMMAKGDAVLLLDVDFLPSRSLSTMYSGAKYQELMDVLDKKLAYVLPAFETTNSGTEGVLLAKRIAVDGKSSVVDAFVSHDVVGFQVDQYSPGHGPDNFEAWVNASAPYRIRYRKGYEPYLLMKREFVPWFDERMRGYSRNKIVQVNLLAEQLGVGLLGHDEGFVVHAPHAKASNFKATKDSGQWETLLDLYIEIRRDISLGEFVPVVSFADKKRWCAKAVAANDQRAVIKKKLQAKRVRRAAKREAGRAIRAGRSGLVAQSIDQPP